jgi:hypothetical protein
MCETDEKSVVVAWSKTTLRSSRKKAKGSGFCTSEVVRVRFLKHKPIRIVGVDMTCFLILAISRSRVISLSSPSFPLRSIEKFLRKPIIPSSLIKKNLLRQSLIPKPTTTSRLTTTT